MTGPAQEVWGAYPTAITGLQVAKLGVAGAIVEIEVTAFLPAESSLAPTPATPNPTVG